MRTTLRKVGNSTAVLIPAQMLKDLQLKANDELDMSVVDDTIVLTAFGSHPRKGWAEASKSLAESGDDALVWPELPNEMDGELVW